MSTERSQRRRVKEKTATRSRGKRTKRYIKEDSDEQNARLQIDRKWATQQRLENIHTVPILAKNRFLTKRWHLLMQTYLWVNLKLHTNK
jgi:hypothetical protein